MSSCVVVVYTHAETESIAVAVTHQRFAPAIIRNMLTGTSPRCNSSLSCCRDAWADLRAFSPESLEQLWLQAQEDTGQASGRQVSGTG